MIDPKRWFSELFFASPVCQPCADQFPHTHRLCRELGIEPPATVTRRQRWYADRLGDIGAAWILMYDAQADPALDATLFMIFVGTDGDDGAVELYDEHGELLGCAFLDGYRAAWGELDAMGEHFPEQEV